MWEWKCFLGGILRVPVRLFALEMPHLQDSFAENLLEVMPRLSSCKPVELVKILQTTLRQSSLLQLALPEQVHIREPRSMLWSHSYLLIHVFVCVVADSQSNSHHHRANGGVWQPTALHLWSCVGTRHWCNTGTRPGPPEHRESTGELDVKLNQRPIVASTDPGTVLIYRILP